MAKNHLLDKEYYERLAKCLLENSLPDIYSNLVMKDRPDLYCFEKDEGIEVVRAMLPNAGDAAGRFKRLSGKKIEHIPQKCIDTFRLLGYKPLSFEGRVGGYASLEASWVSIAPIQKSYLKKMDKLLLYDKHNKNTLFIFSPLFKYYDKRDILEFYQWVQKTNSTYALIYDKVFLYDEPVLYLYDAEQGNIKEYTFQTSILKELCAQCKKDSLH